MRDSAPGSGGDVPTVLVRDGDGKDLLCFLEQLIPLDGQDYALLTPVDTPVSLFRLQDEADPEPITSITSSEPILSVADVVLQEHDLSLVRSAVTLTVSGELDEPDPEELDDEEDDADDESEGQRRRHDSADKAGVSALVVGRQRQDERRNADGEPGRDRDVDGLKGKQQRIGAEQL